MEQSSNVQYRAEKEYKHSREKFFLLLREIISNAIHAVVIRQNKDKETIFTPELNLCIAFNESQCKIELTDNGEGFTENNRECFEKLDKINSEKNSHNFHPLGQGRLAIVYFSDSAQYESVYKDEKGMYHKRTFPYPSTSDGIFNFDKFDNEVSSATNSYTKLTLLINKQNKVNRAKTFFRSYPDINSFKSWFVETFFPFIINNEKLVINISLNGEDVAIGKDYIEAEIKPKSFDVQFSENGSSSFKLWMLKTEEQMHGDNPITCFARNLKAELSNGKLKYTIDNRDGYILYLTSEYFDEYVDTKGEKIEISLEDIQKINEQINKKLDEEFKTIIEDNKRETKRNLKNFKKKYPSLETFIKEETIIGDKNIVNEAEIVKSAIDEKSKIEKKFWNQIDKDPKNDESNYSDSEDCQKLLNSSLHIYVKHRERVLKQLHTLIQKFDDEGVDKPELESSVHELFIKRGTSLSDSSNINHLHNLWILDDKFTIFSDTLKSKSTQSGQSLSDVYIWADDPTKTKQILILELKSTTKAHNAGDRKEGMIAQVKRYAQNFYKNPTKTLNWDVHTDQIQYTGIIVARKSDINKELTSINNSGGYNPIPFLNDSYYYDDSFYKDDSPKNKMNIRIELYSFEDIYELASNRNEVFFRLLKKEFEVDDNDE